MFPRWWVGVIYSSGSKVALVEQSEGAAAVDEASKQKIRERELHSSGLFGGEDALRDRYIAKIDAMSNAELKAHLQTLEISTQGTGTDTCPATAWNHAHHFLALLSIAAALREGR